MCHRDRKSARLHRSPNCLDIRRTSATPRRTVAVQTSCNRHSMRKSHGNRDRPCKWHCQDNVCRSSTPRMCHSVSRKLARQPRNPHSMHIRYIALASDRKSARLRDSPHSTCIPCTSPSPYRTSEHHRDNPRSWHTALRTCYSRVGKLAPHCNPRSFDTPRIRPTRKTDLLRRNLRP
jgi:hypothetical protein